MPEAPDAVLEVPVDLPGVLSRNKVFYQLPAELETALDKQFDEFDIDESGFLDTEAELSLIADHSCWLAFADPFNLKVGSAEIKDFIALGTPLLEYGEPIGLNKILYKNLIVYAYGFELLDGSKPVHDPGLKDRIPRKVVVTAAPYGDPELMGFLEWWEDLYGPEFLDEHPGEGPNGHDPVTEQVLAKAKLEFKTGVVRHTWEMKRAANMTEWRRCVRDNEDVGKCQSEEDHLIFEIRQAKMYEKLARKERNLIGQNVFWLRNASCVADNTSLWQVASKIRADAGYQWFGLIVNLINVFGLMSEDTACEPPDCTNSYQNDILPILDWFAQVFFTFDMINSMVVLGFASYFDNSFLQLDFLVVLTGWMQVAQIGMDVSALRALRVLRPMRLIKYFKGIQAIIGAIVHNIEPIWNVIQFMIFFLIIFGIAGITLFPGQLQHRCVVTGPYPSQTAGITYDEDYASADDPGEMGEFEYHCTAENKRVSFPFPYRCASYMT